MPGPESGPPHGGTEITPEAGAMYELAAYSIGISGGEKHPDAPHVEAYEQGKRDAPTRPVHDEETAGRLQRARQAVDSIHRGLAA